ncbi:6951_t:CDS:2, partial [Rhizophagus irregularis]
GLIRNIDEDDSDESDSQRELEKDHEESQDEDHFRKSETSSEEEEKSSDESEKLINTPGKSFSEHSDKEKNVIEEVEMEKPSMEPGARMYSEVPITKDDFENKEMRIERHEETIVIPISYEKSPEEFEDPESSSDEEEYESDNERTKHK